MGLCDLEREAYPSGLSRDLDIEKPKLSPKNFTGSLRVSGWDLYRNPHLGPSRDKRSECPVFLTFDSVLLESFELISESRQTDMDEPTRKVVN